MSTFFPFGIPSTSSFAKSASYAHQLTNQSYQVSYALRALNGPPGSPGINATSCPPGYINAYSPGVGYTPIPSNPNVSSGIRNSYLLCFSEPGPSPTPTPSVSITSTPSATPAPGISVTPSVTPSITPSPTPSISITPTVTPSITPSTSNLGTIALTIGGTITGGFPDYWIVKSNVPVPVDVVFASGNPEFKGYNGTTAEDLLACNNDGPVESGDIFPGFTLGQGSTTCTPNCPSGPGEQGELGVTFRVTNIAYINTNDGNGSQLRYTGTSWTDSNGRQWSLTITDQNCSTNYPF